MFAIKNKCRKLSIKNNDRDNYIRKNLSKWTLNKLIDLIIRPG